MSLDLGVKKRFAKKFDEFAAWNMLLDMRGLVETTLHSYSESRVLEAWANKSDDIDRKKEHRDRTRIQKISMYETVDLIRCDEKGRRHDCC
jgi:hypothetical protein